MASRPKPKSNLCYARLSVGQSVSVSNTHLGPKITFLLLSDICWFIDVGPPSLTRVRVCRLQFLLASPAQSFSGPNPAGLMIIFYCLRFEPPPTWRSIFPYLYPPETEWPSYSPRHWILFSSPPSIRRAKVALFEPASTPGPQVLSGGSSEVVLERTQKKTPFLC
jgi:hypothetical protein